jgi:hypothetical protein
MKYRKKPVEIEARRFDPEATTTDAQQLAEWCSGTIRTALAVPTDRDSITTYVDIRTSEGVMAAAPGDWIIREPFPTSDRRFYPCKPDIFAATYDIAEEHA